MCFLKFATWTSHTHVAQTTWFPAKMADLPTSVEDTSHVEEKTVHQKRLPTEEECKLLVRAAIKGDMEVVTRLSNDGVDMDAIIHEEYQQTPLHVSAGYGHDNIVKKLISLHVNIECVDVDNVTPLHMACNKGHALVATTLLHNNANIECRTNRNATPLHIACEGGYEPIVKTLLLYNADIECRTDDNSTPLYVAAQDGHNEVVKLLLQSNADVNCVCKAQATPLHVAAGNGHLMVVKTLLAYNAKVDCVNVFNKTPLQYAVEEEKSDVVKCLVEHGKIDINQFDQNYKEKIEKLLRESFNEKLLKETSKDNHSGSPATQKVTNQEKKAYRLAMRDGLAKSSTLRLLVFGPENSGKTCLISTLFEEAFQQNSATQGADVQICTIYAANWCKCSAKEMAEKLQVKFFHKLNTTAQKQAESPSFHATSVDDKEGIASKMKRLFFMSSKAATSPPHKAPEINIEEIRQAKCIEITSEDEFHAVVWDFAGQIEYLNAHTIFVRRHNLVFLVFKASCNLSDPIEARRGDKKASQKVTHFKVIHYWLQTVTSVCNEDGGVNHKSELLPTVVLIATHIDEIEGDVEQAKEDIITQLAKELEGKPYAKHLAGNREGLLDALRKYCFFISNKVRDTKVINRLKEIVQQAATPILEEEHPLVYINIEKELLSLEKDVITTTEFHKVALENGFVADKNSAEIKGALNYFHHKGAILHFDTTDSLKELVFLSPQWLEKLFAFLVIAHPYKPTGDEHDDSYKCLTCEGVLLQSFLSHMLEMFNKTHRAVSHKLSLGEAISFLTKFGFIVEISSSTRLLEQSFPQLQNKKEKYYIVPSQLPETTNDESPILQKGFHWSIHFVFLAGFIPTAVYHNLVAVCITWNATRKQDIAWLTKYEIKMVLNAGQLYFVRLCEEQCSIQLDIFLENSDKSAVKNRKHLISFIQGKLGQICGALMPAAAKPEACVQCPVCSRPHIKYSSLVEGQSQFCRKKQKFVEGNWYKHLFTSEDAVDYIPTHNQPKTATPVSEQKIGSQSSTKDVLIQFAPQLIEIMPMDDAVFISKLLAAGLLPGNLKAEIKSLPTSADKADYFLDHMIFPNLNNDKSNLCTLLSVMEKNSNVAVKNVAVEVKRAIA